MTPRIRDYGDRALLIELGSLDDVIALHRSLALTKAAGVVDLIPAARTLAVTVDPVLLPLSVARTWIEHADPGSVPVTDSEPVNIDVDYSGEDLGHVASVLGITPREVVERHTESTWKIAFTGFAPGFAYLVTDGNPLSVPRRQVPRTAVPAGSVALAGEFSGIYPRQSPGGWQIIGTTRAELWNAHADEPALLAPGGTVRFREI